MPSNNVRACVGDCLAKYTGDSSRPQGGPEGGAATLETARAGGGQAGAGARLEIQEYAVSQTTLEQVFNGFAAQQEEEQGPIRGMEQASQASSELSHEQDNV